MTNDEAYAILGLEKNANKDAIRAAYEKLAPAFPYDQFSPRADDEPPSWEEPFERITQAYQILSGDSNVTPYEAPPLISEWLKKELKDIEGSDLEDSDLLQLNQMSEQDLKLFVQNLDLLLDAKLALNQEAFTLACAHLPNPNQTKYDSPVMAKYVMEAVTIREGLTISSTYDLNAYALLLQPFLRVCNIPFYENLEYPKKSLLNQDRLNQLIKHWSAADALALMITRLDRVDLLSPENEALIIAYLSERGEAQFSNLTESLNSLSFDNQAQILDLLQQAHEELERGRTAFEVLAPEPIQTSEDSDDAPLGIDGVNTNPISVTNSEMNDFEQKKSRIQREFLLKLDNLKSALGINAEQNNPIHPEGIRLCQSLLEIQNEFFQKLTMDLSEKQLEAALLQFRVDCQKNIEAADKVMGRGWLLGLVEGVIKAIVGLFAALGMVLGSLFGQGLLNPEHRKRFADTFFNSNQTQSQALEKFKHDILGDEEHHYGLLSNPEFNPMRGPLSS